MSEQIDVETKNSHYHIQNMIIKHSHLKKPYDIIKFYFYAGIGFFSASLVIFGVFSSLINLFKAVF